MVKRSFIVILLILLLSCSNRMDLTKRCKLLKGPGQVVVFGKPGRYEGRIEAAIERMRANQFSRTSCVILKGKSFPPKSCNDSVRALMDNLSFSGLTTFVCIEYPAHFVVGTDLLGYSRPDCTDLFSHGFVIDFHANKFRAQPNKSFERTTPASHSVLLLALS
jgi:hypothetical protein